jgi:hypothetical protein
LKTFNDPSLEDPLGKHFDQIGCDLDLDKFLKQAVMFSEPSLKDPLGECFAQFEFNLDLDMICEQAKALLDSTPKMQIENGETVEISFPNSSSLAIEPFISKKQVEHIEPPTTPNLSNDKEVNIEVHSFITIPLETQHEP